MGDSKVSVEIDSYAEAAYIRLSNEQVSSTVEVNDLVYVDLDKNKVAVGIEILGLGTPIPLDSIKTDYHIHSSVADIIEMLRPTIAHAWKVATAPDPIVTIHDLARSYC